MVRFHATDRKYINIAHIYFMHVFIMARVYAHDFHSQYFFTLLYAVSFTVTIFLLWYNAIIFIKIKFINYTRLPNDSNMCMWNDFSLILPYTLSYRSTATIWRRLAIIYRNYGKMHQMLTLNVFASFKVFYIIFLCKMMLRYHTSQIKTFLPPH